MDICSPQGAPSTEKGALRAKVRPHEGKSAFVGLAQSLMSIPHYSRCSTGNVTVWDVTAGNLDVPE